MKTYLLRFGLGTIGAIMLLPLLNRPGSISQYMLIMGVASSLSSLLWLIMGLGIAMRRNNRQLSRALLLLGALLIPFSFLLCRYGIASAIPGQAH
jgi:hypothetical protein